MCIDQAFSCTDNVWILRLFFGLCQFVYGGSNNNYLNPQRQTDTDQKTSSESIHSPTQYNYYCIELNFINDVDPVLRGLSQTETNINLVINLVAMYTVSVKLLFLHSRG